ncbi:hypothetical protein [Otariodibacter oris]|uniref:Secreted protein n=1 Tax=Otariodibacter oris TaxID=1032623 RepID=A0A420XHY8_9PAST|nr:hypothetical protein [Otariodibacter oris]QGM80966.1 hypothetical protein A6A10_05890 [Otariodibacter oris]RKR76856.1 hypothetical protein DES31_0164 [Otariodibacter oris]
MKKMIVASLVLALSITSFAEARFKIRKSRTPAVQPHKSQPKPDADFNNTQNASVTNNMNGQGRSTSSGLGNFVTGAAAGYLLSDMLSPEQAQAQENIQQVENMQAVRSESQSANPMNQLSQQVNGITPTVQAFKSIDPNDPNLIEKTGGYARYCLNGVQYLMSTTNNQLPPTLMVDKNNAPVQCVILP